MTEKNINFYFHVGFGKTGSSSIQHFLRENSEQLKISKTFYVGMMYEFAPQIKYEWQRPTTVNLDFHSLPLERMQAELADVIQDCIDFAKENNYTNIVWSNEAFSNKRLDNIMAVIKNVLLAQTNFKIVLYIRRYDKWISSAYIQWGIKHKTYKGKLMPFKDWVKTNPPRFAEFLQNIEHSLPNVIILRNYDVSVDVIKDFCKIIGFDSANKSQKRVNDTPSIAEIYLRAMYVDLFSDYVLPGKFDLAFGLNKSREIANSSQAYLNEFFPKKEDLEVVLMEASNDLKIVNSILEAQGQQVLLTNFESDSSMTGPNLNVEQLIHLLSRMVIFQAKKIEALEDKINEWKKEGGSTIDKS